MCFTGPFRVGFGDSNFQKVSGLLYNSGQTAGMGSSSSSKSNKCCVLCGSVCFLGELIEVLLGGLFAFMRSKLNFNIFFSLNLGLFLSLP